MAKGGVREFLPMIPFSPVTEAELARARQDPAFRQKLLTQNLEFLLGKLQRQQRRRSGEASAKEMREGVTLAVRLAELIQTIAGRSQGS
jgi:hypothetical protein